MIVRAGLSSLPYLQRRQDWAMASRMLEQVSLFDKAPATAAALLPCMRRVLDATRGTERELIDRSLLAELLTTGGQRQQAEAEFRAVIGQAVDREEFRTALAAAGSLTNLLRDAGRLEEALHVIEQQTEYTKRAGFGPWTQLSDECQRLQILNLLGEHEKVLRRVTELRVETRLLPDSDGSNEIVHIWNVREAILNVGGAAAADLRSWEKALDLRREELRTRQERGAPSLDLARCAFNNYAPLVALGRYEEAHDLLVDCREVFEREDWVQGLAMAFSAFAQLEDLKGRSEEAQRFEESALRYKYLAAPAYQLINSHFNIGTYIIKSQGKWSEALAHHLAAALIGVATKSGRATPDFAALVRDLRDAGPEGRAGLPTDFATLCATVERVEGVRFRETIERLVGGPAECGELLRQVVAEALERANKPE
jgi:tetratricopeptide (TPR) repeat protein